ALPGGAAAQPAGAAEPVIAESTLTATISQSLAADTNYDLDPDPAGTTYYGDTRFGLGLLRASETRSLRFLFNSGLRTLDRPDESVEFTVASPSVARVTYDQAFANAAFDIDVSARYRRIERDVIDEDFFIDPDEPPLPPDDPGALPEDVTRIDDETFERRFDLDTGLVLGTEAPSSLGFRLQATDVDYAGDSPEDFSPRSGAELGMLWRLRVNPVLSGVVFGNYLFEDSTEQPTEGTTQDTRIEEAELDLGFTYQPREEASVTLGAGYAKRSETTTLEGVETTEDNSGISLRALGSYATDTLSLQFNTRYTTAAEAARFSGDIRAGYIRPRGVITARLFQTYGLGSEGDDRRVTGAGLSYRHEINSFSGLLFDLRAVNSVSANDASDDLGAAEEDERRQIDFTATYSRDFTRVVRGSLGYRLSQREEDDPGNATSHRVFVEIGRSFVTGF
ncbi:MAG: hypothetical protein M3Y34_02985, partial [Actinomycetota bacterium]|nr:hypothetical protein [Actinomycetota bacterium]